MEGKRTVLIGNGAAAVECMLSMRACGYTGRIDVFAAGDLPVYNPMLTSYYAAGKIDYPVMFPYGNDLSVFDRAGAVLHQSCPVTKLRARDRVVETADGGRYPFDRCLIATGASAFVPPFPGSDSKRMFTMRTVEDAVAVYEAVQTFRPRKALVVGASMVGIKLAELFYKAGVDCVLADMAPFIFPLAASESCAHYIEKRLTTRGIHLMFGAGIERLEDTGEGVRAYFKDIPTPVEADIVMMCIGVRANLGFVDREEIDCKQGVLVDRRMESNIPGIYAAGDCAQGYNLLTGEQQIIGLWANARNQGRTAGMNMAGVPHEYPGEILHNITHFMGMDFVGLGDVKDHTEVKRVEKEDSFAEFFYRGDRLVGANFVDLFESCGVLKHAMLKSLIQAERETPPGQTVTVQRYLLEKLEKMIVEQ